MENTITPNFDRAVCALRHILRINSVETDAEPGQPFGEGCAKALQFALELLQMFGFKTKNIDNYCGYGEIGEGELFAVLGHLDVVPAGDGWTYPPFEAELVDGKIYARGAIDDKGPIIASIFAAAKLLNAGFTPKKRLRFILGCDEESGWKCMERYAKTEEMPASGFSPDADFPVINCEKGIIHYKLSIPLPHGIINFKAGTRANVVPDLAIALVNPSLFPSSLATTNPQITSTPIDDMIQLTACGISAHASTPQEGRNALITILELLAKDSPLLAKIYTAFSSHDGSRCGLNFADEMSGNLTLNLATADIENDILTFKLDIRYPVTHNKETIQGILSNISDNIQIDEEDGHLPLYVPCDDPLVTTLLGSYNKIMNTNLKPCSIGGGTYARFLKHGVAFGPSFPNSKPVVHQKDEYISLEDFSKIIDIYYDALSKLIFS